MKTAKYFDVFDADITPAIYTLLFSNTVVELTGNDTAYSIAHTVRYMTDDVIYRAFDFYDAEWQKRLEHGWQNCYPDNAAMKAYIESEPKFIDAVRELRAYLIKHGVDVETDTVFVKIYW
jgi:hypothetical protein